MSNFESALKELKAGKTAYRTGWNGKGMWIAIHFPPQKHSGAVCMTVPYIFICTPIHIVPWVASQSDILAEDWEIG